MQRLPIVNTSGVFFKTKGTQFSFNSGMNKGTSWSTLVTPFAVHNLGQY
jgi:hypothetical protein